MLCASGGGCAVSTRRNCPVTKVIFGDQASRLGVVVCEEATCHFGRGSGRSDQRRPNVPHRAFQHGFHESPHLIDGHVSVLESVARFFHRFARLVVAREDFSL